MTELVVACFQTPEFGCIRLSVDNPRGTNSWDDFMQVTYVLQGWGASSTKYDRPTREALMQSILFISGQSARLWQSFAAF
jgi:hypothetical protein